ncbi:MAG: DUF4363 family protein [Clostridiales bacterium]|nr:DUF4363 family protein [Clostridiales bacterium]
MRSRLTISLTLLAVVIVCGVMNIYVTKNISNRYVSAAEELRELTGAEDWPRADQTVQAYHQTWKDTLQWLQMLINHSDGDEVSRALERIEAGIRAQEVATCLEGCAELREAAEHIYHRDAFTLGNIL